MQQTTLLGDVTLPRLLVVEDDRLICEELAAALRDDGFVVETAHDGEAALLQIQAHQPDLVLLDLMMPTLNGWQVIERLQGHPQLNDVPIFVITAGRYAAAKHVRYPLFIKPLRLDCLIACIRSFLDVH